MVERDRAIDSAKFWSWHLGASQYGSLRPLLITGVARLFLRNT